MIDQKEILDFISKTLDITDIDENATMGKTRKWDSLNQVVLITALSKEYDVDIPRSMIGRLTGVKAIKTYLQNELG